MVTDRHGNEIDMDTKEGKALQAKLDKMGLKDKPVQLAIGSKSWWNKDK